MNHSERFVDAGYWVALVHTRDGLHRRARALAERLQGPLVTTEPVLIEVCDSLSRVSTREFAVTLMRQIAAEPNIHVVPLTRELFMRALDRYARRPDKEWGLTDCISFIVMEDRGILEALADDQHFIQAGFRALLREE